MFEIGHFQRGVLKHAGLQQGKVFPNEKPVSGPGEHQDVTN
ncbi:hypothetical protein [Lentilactobacillus sunkii]|nr:hypothetical protein [Lentilactobacillus sunkii]